MKPAAAPLAPNTLPDGVVSLADHEHHARLVLGDCAGIAA